jgi:hypothetical protein
MPPPLAGTSVFICIPLLRGFVKLIINVVTVFPLPIRVAVSIPNTVHGSLNLFSPPKVRRDQGWGCGCAGALSTAFVAQCASGAHAAPVVRAPVSRFSYPPRKTPSDRFVADTSGRAHIVLIQIDL